MLRIDLMRKATLVCNSGKCGGRNFEGIPALEGTCPEFGGELQFVRWLNSDRIAYLLLGACISVETLPSSASKEAKAEYRKRARSEVDEIIKTLPPATMYRVDRVDGRGGGSFPNGRRAVAELF